MRAGEGGWRGQGRHRALYLTAITCSLLLAWDGFLRASVINPDGICYLQSAATLGRLGIHAAMQVCGQAKLPFYPWLIHLFSLGGNIAYENAAYLLDGLLSLVTVVTFIYLCQLLRGDFLVQCFGAAAILLLHEFNSVREYVIRDHGYWAFYLVSLGLLIHYLRRPRLRTALGFSGALLIATLFRVEGVFFLLLAPFCVWLLSSTPRARLKGFLQLHAVTFFILITAGVYLEATQQAWQDLSRFNELLFQLKNGVQVLATTFNHKSAALAHAILNDYSARDATLLLGLLLLAWYVWSVLANLSLVYVALAWFAHANAALNLDPAAKLAIRAYVIINVIITAPFLVEYLFLSKRYLIALSLLLLLWVPFGCAVLWRERQRRWLVTSVAFIAVIATALGGIIDFGYSKRYARDAGLWLADHAPAAASIYSNDLQVMFYSRHFGNEIFSKAQAYAALPLAAVVTMPQFDYVALHVNPRDTSALRQLAAQHGYTRGATFANRRGDAILIYLKLKKEG